MDETRPVTTSWDATTSLMQIARSNQSWSQKLEAMAEVLLKACDVDAIWLFTFAPLDLAACGLLRLPAGKPSAQLLTISDTLPPISRNWPYTQTALAQVLESGEARFGVNLETEAGTIDQDLGDVLFGFFDLHVQGIIPIGIDVLPFGVLVLGNSQHRSGIDLQLQHWLVGDGRNTLALSLQNASLIAQEQKQTRQILSLTKIARTVTARHDQDGVILETIRSIDDVLNVEAGSLLLFDEARNELYFKITLRGESSLVNTQRLQPGEGVAGWVFYQQRPAMVNDTSQDPRFSRRIDTISGFQTRSLLAVPLILNGRAIGVLEVLNKRSGHFTESDLSLLIFIGSALAIALENANLYQQWQAEVRYTQQVSHLISVVNAGLNLDDTSINLVLELRKLFVFDGAVISLLSDNRQQVDSILYNDRATAVDQIVQLPLSQTMVHFLQQTSDSCAATGLTGNILAEAQWLLGHRFQQAIVVLFRSESLVLGALTLVRHTDLPFSATDMQRLQDIASALSTALEKARLLESSRRRNVDLEALNQLGERLQTKPDFDFVLDTVLEYLPILMPADVHGFVLHLDDTVRLGIRLPENAQDDLLGRIQKDVLHTLEDSDANINIPHLDNTRVVFGNTAVSAEWEIVSSFSWPILTHTGSLGLIYLAYGQPITLSAEQLRLFSLTTSRISSSVENVLLFNKNAEKRARLMAVLNSTQDGILVVDQNTHIILDNPAARTILAYDEAQLGQALKAATHNTELLELFEEATSAGTVTREFTNDKDQTFFTSVSPVRSEKNMLLGWVAVMKDITQLKELDAARDTFLSVVSHDLKAPLNSISIASQFLNMAGPLNDLQSKQIGTINDQINYMSDLINDLLDVSKIDANINMDMAPQHLEPILTHAIESLQPQIEQKDLSLVYEPPPETCWVEGNVGRLHQVFLNLIGNAVKYTPEGGRMTVRLVPYKENVLFQVVDTGIGIPEKDLDRIFDRFHRVYSEETEDIKGTGLGLAIVKSIVEKHGGHIWVESQLGQGSTFSLVLPTCDPLPG